MGSGFQDFYPPEYQQDKWVAVMCGKGGVLNEVKISNFNQAF